MPMLRGLIRYHMRRSKTWIRGLGLSLLLGLASISIADAVSAQTIIWEPPSSDDPVLDNLKATGSTDILPTLHIANVYVVLDRTSFKNVQARLGGTFGEEGDAANTIKWLCYYQRRSPMPWVIWLTGGEITGPTIGGFRWQYLPRSAPPDSRCTALPASGKVALPAPLMLGQTRSKAISALGMPSESRPNALYYRHARTFYPRETPELPFTTTNIAIVSLRNGVIDAIVAGRSTSD